MKGVLALIAVFSAQIIHSQIVNDDWCFDPFSACSSSPTEANLYIDYVNNPSNIWQIGSPQKTTFTMAQSAPNVLVTDSINAYPINDTSAFYIGYFTTEPSNSIHWDIFDLSFSYYVDCDSLTDKGLIEFSVDNGTTWIDLINDPNYSSYLNWSDFGTNAGNNPPILTGSSGGWRYAVVVMDLLAQTLNIPAGSYIQWRFSFVSDSIQNNRDGLMFDNINLTIAPPVGIVDHNISNTRKCIKVLDLLGREIEVMPNSPMIYFYDDGTTEKVYQLED